MGVAWQNTAYNQPPHLGYYLPDYLAGKLPATGVSIATVANQGDEVIYDLHGRQLPALQRGLNIVRKGNEVKKVFIK